MSSTLPHPAGTPVLAALAAAALGETAAQDALAVLAIAPALMGPLLPETGADTLPVPRATVAMALNVALFAGLLPRVPAAARHVADLRAAGARTVFDHGALRTIDGMTGALPRGSLAITRLLAPLGYGAAATYPLPRLRMTGRAWVHHDFPEDIPQFFVSELHIHELPEAAQAVAARVFGDSRDPLAEDDRARLEELAETGALPFGEAAALLPGLVACFDRQHPIPAEADYRALLAASAEAGWIATEGNAFNHATNRVPDVDALAARLKAEGFAMKDAVEVSANRRVRQTATIADKVAREFVAPDGSVVTRQVPGSFFEFITRAELPGEHALDLTFDAGNATGIFAVTRA